MGQLATKVTKIFSPTSISSVTGVIVTEEMLEARKKRRNVVTEILTSEERYSTDLNNFVRVYITPLRDAALAGKSHGLSVEELDSLFGEYARIAEVHGHMYRELQELEAKRESADELPSRNKHQVSDASEEKVHAGTSDTHQAHIVLRYAAAIRTLYGPYVSRFGTSMKKFSEFASKHKKFAAFLDSARENSPECRGLDMPSFLIMPIQRVPRYEMLLTSLREKTIPEDPVYDTDVVESIDKALDAVHEIAVDINEQRRSHEQLLRLAHLQSSMKFGMFQKPVTILHSDRSIVYEKEIELKSSKSVKKDEYKAQSVFVFNDALLWVSLKNKFKGIVMLDGFTKVSPNQDSERKFCVDVHGIETSSQSEVELILSFEDQKTRDEWLAALRPSPSGLSKVPSHRDLNLGAL